MDQKVRRLNRMHAPKTVICQLRNNYHYSISNLASGARKIPEDVKVHCHNFIMMCCTGVIFTFDLVLYIMQYWLVIFC